MGQRPLVLSLAYFTCPMLCSLGQQGEADAFRESGLRLGRGLRRRHRQHRSARHAGAGARVARADGGASGHARRTRWPGAISSVTTIRSARWPTPSASTTRTTPSRVSTRTRPRSSSSRRRPHLALRLRDQLRAGEGGVGHPGGARQPGRRPRRAASAPVLSLRAVAPPARRLRRLAPPDRRARRDAGARHHARRAVAARCAEVGRRSRGAAAMTPLAFALPPSFHLVVDTINKALQTILMLPEQASTVAKGIDGLQYLELGFYSLIAIVYMGTAVFFLIRFRRRGQGAVPRRHPRARDAHRLLGRHVPRVHAVLGHRLCAVRAPARRARRGDGRLRDRQAVDVEVRLRRRRRVGRRALRPGRRAGPPAAHLARRHPQLLGAGVPPEAGRSAGHLHVALVRGEAARHAIR